MTPESRKENENPKPDDLVWWIYGWEVKGGIAFKELGDQSLDNIFLSEREAFEQLLRNYEAKLAEKEKEIKRLKNEK